MSDFFSILMNGSVVSSVVVILAAGVIGALLAYVMPYFTADGGDV